MRRRLDRFDPRNAVITGAGSGLGRAMAIRLARQGWKVGAADIDEARAAETIRLVREAGGSGEACRCDVRAGAGVDAMARRFFDDWGRVTLLVNNAGVAVAGIMGEITEADWKKAIDTNLWGAVNGCGAFVPLMKSTGGGHIINVASAAGYVCLPEMAPYNTTKAAVIALSETLRSELAPSGIGVTVACPTFFNTRLLENMTYTDEFQIEFASSAFSNAKMSADEVARRILEAAGKNRLYAFPQPSAKWTRVTKGHMPRLHFAVLSIVSRFGLSRPLARAMARRGLV